MKKHNADEIESIEVLLTKSKTPIAYEAKKAELVKGGMTPDDAEKFIDTTPIEIELYYSPDMGLFAVESEAVESCPITNPYTGEELEEADED